MALALLFGSGTPSAAQEPSEPPDTALRDAPSRITTLADLGFEAVRTTGSHATEEFYFAGSGDFELGRHSKLIVVLSHSNLLSGDSAANVALNGRALRAIRLDEANVEPARYEIPVPLEAIERGFNRLTFEFAMSTGKFCEDPMSPALFSTIHPETGLILDFASDPPEPQLDPPDLSAYPYPFFHAGYPVVAPVTVLIPDEPSGAELTAAYQLASNLAARVSFDLELLRLLRVGDADAQILAEHQLLVVGRPERNPLIEQVLEGADVEVRASGLVHQGGSLPGEVGVLALQPSPWNAELRAMAVTGATDAAVARSVQALTSVEPAALLAGATALLTEPVVQPPRRELDRVFTFAQAGGGERTIRGTATQTHSITFSAPAPVPGASGALDLVVSTPRTLDRGRSNLVVELNGDAVATVELTEAEGRRASYRVELPGDVLRVGPNVLLLRTTLYAPEVAVNAPCTSTAPERVWATFHDDSAIALPPTAGVARGADLSALPFPFAGLEGLRDTTFVVDATNLDSIRGGMLAAIGLGRRFRARDDFEVQPASAAAPELLGDRHVVAVALPPGSPLDEQASRVLPLLLRPDGSRALVAEQDVLAEILVSSQLGAIQETAVPWAEQRRLLSISGTDAIALGWASNGLTRGGLDGNVAIFQSPDQFNTFSLERVSEAELDRLLNERFTKEEARTKTILGFALIGGASALLLALWGIRGRIRPGSRR